MDLRKMRDNVNSLFSDMNIPEWFTIDPMSKNQAIAIAVAIGIITILCFTVIFPLIDENMKNSDIVSPTKKVIDRESQEKKSEGEEKSKTKAEKANLQKAVLSESEMKLAAQFGTVCPNKEIPYCNEVGSFAYNAQGDPAQEKVKVGKIIGVLRVKEGDVIEMSRSDQQTGEMDNANKAERDAHYCIIDDGTKNPFLRECQEIKARK